MRWKRNQDMTSNFPLNLERISFLLKSVSENKHFHEVFFHSYQIIDTNSCWSTIILMFHLIIQTSVITQSLIKSSQWAKKRKKQCNRVREGQQNWQNLIAPQALFQQLYI